MSNSASDIFNEITSKKWYKKYIRLVNKDIDVTNYRVMYKRIEAIVKLMDLDVKFISNGLNRVVFEYKGYAIKLLISWNSGIIRERDLLDYLQCNTMISLSEHLHPMLINNDYLAIFPLCEKYEIPVNDIYASTNGSSTLMGEELDDILDSFIKQGIILDDVTKVEQWGRYNNKLLLLDYEDYIIEGYN